MFSDELSSEKFKTLWTMYLGGFYRALSTALVFSTYDHRSMLYGIFTMRIFSIICCLLISFCVALYRTKSSEENNLFEFRRSLCDRCTKCAFNGVQRKYWRVQSIFCYVVLWITSFLTICLIVIVKLNSIFNRKADCCGRAMAQSYYVVCMYVCTIYL
jgi:hypothetical protein